MKRRELTSGACAAALWLGVIVHADYLEDALAALAAAKVVILLFHHRRRTWRVAAILLSPLLLWTYFLPKATAKRLKELAAMGK